MRHGRPSQEQLQLNFENMLARALAGQGLRSSTGLDEETRTALRAIARAHPNATDDLVESARQAFAGQLDGSNAARWHAQADQMLSEMESRSRESD